MSNIVKYLSNFLECTPSDITIFEDTVATNTRPLNKLVSLNTLLVYKLVKPIFQSSIHLLSPIPPITKIIIQGYTVSSTGNTDYYEINYLNSSNFNQNYVYINYCYMSYPNVDGGFMMLHDLNININSTCVMFTDDTYETQTSTEIALSQIQTTFTIEHILMTGANNTIYDLLYQTEDFVLANNTISMQTALAENLQIIQIKFQDNCFLKFANAQFNLIIGNPDYQYYLESLPSYMAIDYTYNIRKLYTFFVPKNDIENIWTTKYNYNMIELDGTNVTQDTSNYIILTFQDLTFQEINSNNPSEINMCFAFNYVNLYIFSLNIMNVANSLTNVMKITNI